MDVIEIVKKDHDRVEELFSRFKGGGGITGLVRRVTGNVPPRQRRAAVAAICRELDVHARVEEEILYPAIQATGDPELARMVTESLREHARVKELVAALRRPPEGEELDRQVAALEECVQHHVTEEERDMLPRVEALVPEQERARLGRRMQARKRALSTRVTAAARPRRATTGRDRRATTQRRARTVAGRRNTRRKKRPASS